MNDFIFTKEAFEQYLEWQQEDKKTLKRINALIKDICSNGLLKGIGKHEKLKNRSEYSRRIDEKNRLVYEMDEQQNIKIIACKSHYED